MNLSRDETQVSLEQASGCVEPLSSSSEALFERGEFRPQLEVAGHELTLFEHSQPLIEAMVEDIKSARQRVWLESYIFVDDDAGRAVADALAARAAAGVDVRVMYDALGCLSTPQSFFNRLSEAGVQVHAYHTLREALLRLSLFRTFNRRNHRKLLVVDERVAYFGGMNIVDQSGIETVEDAKARHLPVSGGWRDLHVRLEGPQQAEIAEMMDHLWRRVHRQKLRRRRPFRLKQMLNKPPETISLFDLRPGIKLRRAERVMLPLLRRARRSITLSMAYFVPYGRILRELVRARRRGVRVRVIVPQKSDVKLVQSASRHLYTYLLSRGIGIYERRDCMLHSKVMVIDDEWTVIGSCNVDPRSFRLNLEFIGVIRAPSLAECVQRICRYDLRNSRRVTRDTSRRRHWWQRLTDRLAWMFRRWL